jgi:glycosyltransferase involved in cell wall biosynthesis
VTSVRPQARILHLIDTGGPGGAETVLVTLTASLPPDLWQSKVVIPEVDWLAEQLRRQQAEVAVVPWGRAFDPRYVWRLAREVRSFRPNVIHAHLLGSGVYGTLASLLANGPPLLCTFHGRPDVSVDDPLRPIKGRILSRPTNRVAYVSHDLRAHLEPLLGIPSRLGVVIHNGVPFSTPPVTGRERAECGAGPSDILVGAIGNVRAPKDYPNLLRAAAIVCVARPNVQFAIAGGGAGPLWEELHRLRNELGLADRVRFLGFRSDARALMSVFDLFVSSSSTEGLPLATVEAMGMAKPLVVTNCGGVPEVVEHGVTGLLVPPRDPGALAAGIEAQLAFPERASSMAAAGARSARLRFDERRMASEYQSLYRTLITAVVS